MGEGRYQDWKTSGTLKGNSDFSLKTLKEVINGSESMNRVYSYVVATVALEENELRQYGSGPNLEGDVLTLCTCKHYMRSWSTIDEDVWIAGVTSRSGEFEDTGHCLFYLAQIKSVVENFPALHTELAGLGRTDAIQRKKASENSVGDFYEFKGTPEDASKKALRRPENYVKPVGDHVHYQHGAKDSWRDDIGKSYSAADPKLIVGEPKMTYAWSSPSIRYDGKHYRGQKKWETLGEFLGRLEPLEGEVGGADGSRRRDTNCC